MGEPMLRSKPAAWTRTPRSRRPAHWSDSATRSGAAKDLRLHGIRRGFAVTMGSGNRFSAVDATLGYLYQVQLALLWALRRSWDKPDFLVSLEILDDVAFEI